MTSIVAYVRDARPNIPIIWAEVEDGTGLGQIPLRGNPAIFPQGIVTGLESGTCYRFEGVLQTVQRNREGVLIGGNIEGQINGIVIDSFSEVGPSTILTQFDGSPADQRLTCQEMASIFPPPSGSPAGAQEGDFEEFTEEEVDELIEKSAGPVVVGTREGFVGTNEKGEKVNLDPTTFREPEPEPDISGNRIVNLGSETDSQRGFIIGGLIVAGVVAFLMGRG